MGFLLEVWFHSNDQRFQTNISITSDIAGLLPPNESYLILHAVACWLLSANSVACSPWKRISCNLAIGKKCACIVLVVGLITYPTDLASLTKRHLKSLVFTSITKQIGAYFSGPLAPPWAIGNTFQLYLEIACQRIYRWPGRSHHNSGL